MVEPLPVGDCAWFVPEAGGLSLCVWVFEGELVCAWLEGVVTWLVGWLVWAWFVELLDAGACVVLVGGGRKRRCATKERNRPGILPLVRSAGEAF